MFKSNIPVTPSPNTHNSVVPSSHNTWNQQPPEYMPWGLLPQPRVTRFSGEPDNQSYSSQESLALWNTHNDIWRTTAYPTPAKRKIEDPLEGQVRKQLITEDKISAHMSQLHIGAAPSQEQSLDIMEEDNGTCLDGIKIDAKSKIVLSDEIRHFQQENSIPPSLLENFAKPTMAVVLWQPRNSVQNMIRDINSGSPSRPTTDHDHDGDVEIAEDDSNNNEPISNFNLNEVAVQQELEPEMDDDL